RCGCQLSQRKYFVPQPFVRKLCHHDVTVTIIAPTRDIPWTAANIPSARTHRNLRGARPNEGFDRGEQDADKTCDTVDKMYKTRLILSHRHPASMVQLFDTSTLQPFDPPAAVTKSPNFAA